MLVLSPGCQNRRGSLQEPGEDRRESATPEDTWDFSLAPQLWVASIAGDAETDIAIPRDGVTSADVIDTIETGASIFFAGRNGTLGFQVNATVFDLNSDTTLPGGLRLDLNGTMVFGDVVATYAPMETLSFLAGVRHLSLRPEIQTSGPIAIQADESVTEWDPIVGLEGHWELSDVWRTRLRGDVGGFGLSSDLTFQIIGGIEYSLSDSVYLHLGVQGVGWQGLELDRLEADLYAGGVTVGIGFRL